MRNLFFCVLFLFSLSGFSQNKKEKKDIKAYKIKAVTVMVTEFDNSGKENTRKDSYTTYDKNADILVNEEYRRDGSLKYKEVNKYDSNGNKTEETIFEAADNTLKAEANAKHVCKYDIDDNKTEDLEYDKAGKLVSKTQFSYNSKGNKVLEATFDPAGKLVKKVVYSYDSKGLKVERKEYNGLNVQLSSRKYQYQF